MRDLVIGTPRESAFRKVTRIHSLLPVNLARFASNDSCQRDALAGQVLLLQCDLMNGF